MWPALRWQCSWAFVLGILGPRVAKAVGKVCPWLGNPRKAWQTQPNVSPRRVLPAKVVYVYAAAGGAGQPLARRRVRGLCGLLELPFSVSLAYPKQPLSTGHSPKVPV